MRDSPKPFVDLDRMLERFGRQFEDATSRWESVSGIESWGDGAETMRLDLARDEDVYVVTADLPGFERDEIEVKIDGRTLLIVAEAGESTIEEDHRLLKRERQHRSASRTIRLPEAIEGEEAGAELRNGVLTVRLPRLDHGEGVEIDIE